MTQCSTNLEDDMKEFFSQACPTRAECDDLARTRFGGLVEPVLIQGATSYTVFAWSQNSGAMWLHIVLSSGFLLHDSLPFVQLKQALPWFDTFKAGVWRSDEMEAFMTQKVEQFKKYDRDIEEEGGEC